MTAADKLALDGPAGNGGDVYVNGGGSGLATGVDQGLFMNLDDAGIDTSLFIDGALEDFKYQGSLYGIPSGAECPALIYNKALIQEIPDTWEELMDVCLELTDVANEQYGFMMDVTNPYFANALYDANGGYIFGVTDEGYDIEDIGLNSEGTKATVKEFLNYFDSGLLQRNMTFDVMEKNFTEGKVAVIYDGPWAVAGFKEAGIDVGELDEIKNDPVQSAFADQLVNSIPQPNVPETALIYDPMISAMELIISQGEDVDSTLDKAVEQIKEQIAIMHQ